MKHSRRNHRKSSNMLGSIQKTSNKVLPVVDKGLKNVGQSAKSLAVKSVPVVEKVFLLFTIL